MERSIAARAMLVLVSALALAACDEGGGDAGADAAALETSGEATGLGLDASTADAMSIDVAAGGVEPAVDPAEVGEIVEARLAAEAGTDETPAEEPPAPAEPQE